MSNFQKRLLITVASTTIAASHMSVAHAQAAPQASPVTAPPPAATGNSVASQTSAPQTAPAPEPLDTLPAPAPAPTVVAAAPPPQAQGPDIVVTGSRITRSGFSAPTPTTVIGADEINRTGSTNVAQVLNTLPAFRATVSGNVRTFTMDAGGNYVDLRGLGIARTLTLVNGQRHVPSNITGQVDLNLIPSILIGRTEVVTGGASAAYGSDAVAGVVNLIYKTNVEGIEGDIQTGISNYSDNKEVNVSLLYGTKFADGKGSFTLAGQWVDNRGADGFDSRDWGRTNYLLIPNPNYVAGNGQPSRLFVANARQSNTTVGGLINSPGVLKGTQFANDGTPVPFVYGSLVGAQNMVGGSGNVLSPYQLIAPPTTRWSINGHLTYELGSSVTAGLELSMAQDKVQSRGGTAQTQTTIQADNAFLPASVRAAMTAAGVSSFVLGRQNSDISPDPNAPWYGVNNRGKVWRGVFTLDGKVGSDWTWNAYAEHGEMRHDEYLVGNLINANFNRAVDAVVNPANGQIVCRGTLSPDPNVRAANAGCAPYNVFGYFRRSPEAQAYVAGNTVNDVRLSENVAAASAQGKAFSTWAGEVSVAFGLEYREDKVSSKTDPISQANGFNNYNPKPISGTYNVLEAFAEADVPLAKDLPFAKSLELNLGARTARYNLAGTVTSWKAGLNYEPVSGIRFRATRSRDVRAPNLSELFSTTSALNQTLIDPVNNSGTTVSVISGGNRNLKPEVSNTTTLGVVINPAFARRFRLSIDAYDIEVKNVISTLNPQDAINRCFAGETDLCGTVVRDTSGKIVTVSQQYQNFASLKTRGIDFEALYQIPLGGRANLTLRALATYVDKLETSDGVTSIDVAGETSGLRVGDVPHWQARGVVDFDLGRLSLSGTVRFIGAGKQDALGTPDNINDNHVPSRTYLQLSGSYDVFKASNGRRIQLYAVIDNLFDSDPPPTAGTSWIQTNQVLFDLIGRSYSAGVRFKF